MFKIVSKEKLKKIAEAIRDKNGKSEHYFVNDFADEIKNISFKKVDKQFDESVFLNCEYVELDDAYYFIGWLHNPIVMDGDIVVYPAIYNAEVDFKYKTGQDTGLTNEKGRVVFCIVKKEINPFDFDEIKFNYKDIVSNTINPFLRLRFKGDKLAHVSDVSDWFDFDNGFRFYVDGELKDPSWSEDYLYQNLEDKQHDIHIFNLIQAFNILPDECFTGWNIIEANIPENINIIGDSCFKNCTYLKKIEMNNTITQIGKSCFENNTNLKEINLSEKITEIPPFCFSECKKLEEINIPETVTSIGTLAFKGCDSLKTIIMNPIKPPEQLGSFMELNTEKVQLVVPDNSIPYYKSKYPLFKNMKKISEYEEGGKKE